MALPLQPELLALNALSRFHVALAMALGAPMQVREALIVQSLCCISYNSRF
jgi:hypothetical protein